MRTKAQDQRIQGFTIIELLVVISIIMILAGLLLPALARSREKARTTTCIGQLKQIGVSCFIYSSDGDGCFPCYSEGAYEPINYGSRGATPMWRLGPRPWYRSLAGFHGSSKALVCPTSKFRYAVNIEMQQKSAEPFHRASGIPVRRIEDPSEKFLVGDGEVTDADERGWGCPKPVAMSYWTDSLMYVGPHSNRTRYKTIRTEFPVGELAGWHLGRTAMLYCDGRVATFLPDSSTRNAPQALTRHWIPGSVAESLHGEFWSKYLSAARQ